MSVREKERYDAIYLSPHLDDAALSCGGQIHRQTQSGRHVAVLTVFAGDLEDDADHRLLCEVYGRMGLRPSEAMEIRRREDQAACRRLGAQPIHWHLVEALGRHSDLETLDALFDEPAVSDQVQVDELAARLKEFHEVGEIFAPLALGGHLDHHIVQRAAERAFRNRITFYEDFPYVVQVKDIGNSPETAGLAPRVVELGSEDLTARVESIEQYTSQIRSLFGSRIRRLIPGRSVSARVHRYVREVGGERLWRFGGEASFSCVV